MRGFKTLKTAYATIMGFEVMRALRQGQAPVFNVTQDICGEARIVNVLSASVPARSLRPSHPSVQHSKHILLEVLERRQTSPTHRVSD